MKLKLIFLAVPLSVIANNAFAAIANEFEPATRGYVYSAAMATKTSNEAYTLAEIEKAAENYATAAQGALADTALQEESDPLAMAAIENKADKATTYTKTEVDDIVAAIDVGGFECTGSDGQYITQIVGGVATCTPFGMTGDVFAN